MEENKCYIPLDIQISSEFYSGFGKKELFRSLIGSVIGLAFSSLCYLIFQSTIGMIVMIMIFIACSFSINIRDRSTNLSFVDEIGNVLRFIKVQKYYSWQYLNEWKFDISEPDYN